MPRIIQKKSHKTKGKDPKSKSKSISTGKSPDPTPKKVNSSRQYTKFNDEILKLHVHLEEFIRKDKTHSSRYICIACKENGKKDFSGYYDYLAEQ